MHICLLLLISMMTVTGYSPCSNHCANLVIWFTSCNPDGRPSLCDYCDYSHPTHLKIVSYSGKDNSGSELNGISDLNYFTLFFLLHNCHNWSQAQSLCNWPISNVADFLKITFTYIYIVGSFSPIFFLWLWATLHKYAQTICFCLFVFRKNWF